MMTNSTTSDTKKNDGTLRDRLQPRYVFWVALLVILASVEWPWMLVAGIVLLIIWLVWQVRASSSGELDRRDW